MCVFERERVIGMCVYTYDCWGGGGVTQDTSKDE